MAFLNSTQQALAAGRGVFFARLVFLNVSSGVKRLWEGFGPLSLDSNTWDGDGSLVAISDIPADLDLGAGGVTLTLSGVADWAIAIARDAALVRGRQATIWGQFFSEALAPSDSKFLLFDGEMDVPKIIADGVGLQQVELTIEGDNADRNGAPFANFSDRDQRRRFSGDRGLEEIAKLGNLKVRWPP